MARVFASHRKHTEHVGRENIREKEREQAAPRAPELPEVLRRPLSVEVPGRIRATDFRYSMDRPSLMIFGTISDGSLIMARSETCT